MKKEINSKSRRKWIMGGLAAFASVALLTTGFAVWIVGVTKDKANGDIGVTVDTAQNNNIEFNVALDDSNIRLAEPKDVTEGFAKASGITDANKEDFSISFEKFEIKIGTSVVNEYKSVKLSLIDNPSDENGGKTDDTTYVNQYAGENLVGDLATQGGRPTSNATYFDLAITSIALPTENSDTADTNGLTRTTKGSIVTFEMTPKFSFTMFKWGTFFNSVSPCTFYNTIFAAKKDQTIENADKIVSENDAMVKKYKDAKLCLHLELSKEA